ncbi:hypothetical protein BASA50_007630 [Batrachochytrium salamandrivorans]|uniref:Uncharacterized protein n=1 Tax=Batrachochytrium salamandrivorans TaxID=1357716 RepID=A0ABQ8F6I8_9FUNG|nr:hypothetical protein BASA60_005360 [Batrachochytrium salamandrivorans]KAH6587997.1 hypothetical protein BASA61_006146 [Batrachochytrium salamandrivorans]KAH6593110.1 hypothetical protein BASA50_007630 [Batrachochytrium salamandrivorans]
MKFNALVVAAMVITSVNAGRRGGFRGWLGGGRMTGSESRERPGGSQDLDPAKKELGSGSGDDDTGKELVSYPNGAYVKGGSGNKSNGVVGVEPSPICALIASKLYDLWNEIDDFDFVFRSQMLTYYRLMVRGDKNDENGDLNFEEARVWLKFHPEAIPELQEIKAKYTGFEGNYYKTWAELAENNCLTEKLKSISPKEMIKQRYFPQWQDENGVDIFDG